MKRKGVPVVAGSDGPVLNEEMALKVAKKIGFPIILKASAGGGGHGMKIVKEEKEIDQAFYMAQREALTAFGNSEIYIEEYIPELRHVEVQIVADNKGNTVYLGDRDCSIQRRHQKLIEESPSPISSTEKFRKRIGELGVKAARAIKYRNVGTVEFIVDAERRCPLYRDQYPHTGGTSGNGGRYRYRYCKGTDKTRFGTAFGIQAAPDKTIRPCYRMQD